MPDNTGKNETILTDKINELESLLNGQTEQAATSDFRPAEFRSGVPILDNLFEQETMPIIRKAHRQVQRDRVWKKLRTNSNQN